MLAWSVAKQQAVIAFRWVGGCSCLLVCGFACLCCGIVCVICVLIQAGETVGAKLLCSAANAAMPCRRAAHAHSARMEVGGCRRSAPLASKQSLAPHKHVFVRLHSPFKPSRGTSSMENVMTDIKAWPVLHQPERKYKGRTVRCHAGKATLIAQCWEGVDCTLKRAVAHAPAPHHTKRKLPSHKCQVSGNKQVCNPAPLAGFYKAWLSGGFSEKVLKRLRELDDQVEGHMRFWVTGGALFSCRCAWVV